TLTSPIRFAVRRYVMTARLPLRDGARQTDGHANQILRHQKLNNGEYLLTVTTRTANLLFDRQHRQEVTNLNFLLKLFRNFTGMARNYVLVNPETHEALLPDLVLPNPLYFLAHFSGGITKRLETQNVTIHFKMPTGRPQLTREWLDHAVLLIIDSDQLAEFEQTITYKQCRLADWDKKNLTQGEKK
ncbi:MAG: hypothetical protein PHQ27_05520, partial [Victivallales bacterium]|nr:hypothetical protein [Victivallales bacterium]